MDIAYIVLYCFDIEKSKDFYESLGFSLTKEQHENGPEHYSFKSNGIIFELYPGKVSSKIRIGLLSPTHEKIILSDPDGNKIELM